MRKEDQNNLYTVVQDPVPKNVLNLKNKGRSWAYGYDSKYDLIVISKNGKIGEVININGLIIALPEMPKTCWGRNKKAEQQYWERQDLPQPLKKINSMDL